MTLWLPHQPLPEGKYLYEVKKQLLWEPIQSLCSVINSSLSCAQHSWACAAGPGLLPGTGPTLTRASESHSCACH